MAERIDIDSLQVRVPGPDEAFGARVAQGVSAYLAEAAPQLSPQHVDSLSLRVELAEGAAESAVIAAIGRAITRALSE